MSYSVLVHIIFYLHVYRLLALYYAVAYVHMTIKPPYLQLSEHRVVLDAGEQDPHGVRPVVQVGDPGPVQVARQLVDVRLQLGEGWGEEGGHSVTNEGYQIWFILVSIG